MDQTQRLFIAIDLPADVKALLADLQSRLRQLTRAVRWSDPGGTHLTLKFLGNVDVAMIHEIINRMGGAAARSKLFRLQTGDLGVFPNAKRPRVVWLGVGGDLTTLGELQADVERSIAPLGFPTERRQFSPHLTLGRSIKEPSSVQLAGIGQAVAQTRAPRRVVFGVEEIVLMRSELRPGGASYTALARARLDGPQ
jgi:2'-5' RNA ligase